ncbi:MAG: PIN domain-containing protein [Candidatus Micrarchaeota archaeon]|nr:PIN domain-containing protein [Candidatus Micrarchaeota archaeon]
MKKVVLDTNFLLSQYEQKVDLIEGLLHIADGPVQIIIPSGAVEELEALSCKGGRRASAARFALGAIQTLSLKIPTKILKSSGEVDKWIFKFATKNKTLVATNDRALRKKLASARIGVVVLKHKCKIGIV